MEDAPKIKSITVEIEDGRWQQFSAADLTVVREFGGLYKAWRLLEFITELSPPVAATDDIPFDPNCFREAVGEAASAVAYDGPWPPDDARDIVRRLIAAKECPSCARVASHD